MLSDVILCKYYILSLSLCKRSLPIPFRVYYQFRNKRKLISPIDSEKNLKNISILRVLTVQVGHLVSVGHTHNCQYVRPQISSTCRCHHEKQCLYSEHRGKDTSNLRIVAILSTTHYFTLVLRYQKVYIQALQSTSDVICAVPGSLQDLAFSVFMHG